MFRPIFNRIKRVFDRRAIRAVVSVTMAPTMVPSSPMAVPQDAPTSVLRFAPKRRSTRSKTERNRRGMLTQQQAVRRQRGQNHRSGRAA